MMLGRAQKDYRMLEIYGTDCDVCFLRHRSIACEEPD